MDIALKAIQNAQKTRGSFIALPDFGNLTNFVIPGNLLQEDIIQISGLISSLRDIELCDYTALADFVEFNPLQQGVLMDLEEIMCDADVSLSSLLSRLDVLETDLSSSILSVEEQLPLIIGIEVAKSTLQYWDVNINQWLYTLTGASIEDELINSLVFNWKQLGKADVAGAVGGVAGWGVAALFGGPVGWKVVAAAAVGGAVVASIEDTIMQLWCFTAANNSDIANYISINTPSEEELFNYLYELSYEEKMELINQVSLVPEAMERLMNLLLLRSEVYDAFISLLESYN